MAEEFKKRKDLSVQDKIHILENFDQLPKMGQRNASLILNISQPLLCKILKNREQVTFGGFIHELGDGGGPWGSFNSFGKNCIYKENIGKFDLKF